MKHDNWVTENQTPSIFHEEADTESRKHETRTKWNRTKMQQNYNTYVKRWIQYCGKINIKEPCKASFADGMAFL